MAKTKENSLQREMHERISLDCKDKSNSLRKNSYRAAEQFDRWRKDKGISAHDVRSEPARYAQRWIDERLSEGRTPATVHTDAAGLCKGLGISMSDIDTPKRTIASKVKSWGLSERSEHALERSENQRVIDFQRMVGGRREALQSLTGADFHKDKDGHDCVWFKSDKGGKDQAQVIAPQDVERVRSYFEGRGPEERIFSEEIDRHLDLHALRAEHARNEYERYVEICKTPEGREDLQRQLYSRYIDPEIGCKAYLVEKDEERKKELVREFQREVEGSPYYLRGDNRKHAEDTDQPVEYDRTRLAAVSVFALSHWRNEVTVKHYMLK